MPTHKPPHRRLLSFFCRKNTKSHMLSPASFVLLMMGFALGSCAPQTAPATDASSGVHEVWEVMQDVMWGKTNLALGPSVSFVSPNSGFSAPAPATMDFSLLVTNWQYPSENQGVQVYLDGVLVAHLEGTYTFQLADLPMGRHVVSAVLVERVGSGWTELLAPEARANVPVEVTGDSPGCLDSCDDGSICSTDGCYEELCEYGAVADCSVSRLECAPGEGLNAATGECGSCDAGYSCDDGNPCTTDTCDAGTCVNTWTENAGAMCCVAGSNLAGICGDWNACTEDACVDGWCQNNPIGSCCTQDTDCDDADSCTLDICDGASNTCSHLPLCCTIDDHCDDGNGCSLDGCDVDTCQHTGDPTLGAGCCAIHGDCGPGGLNDDGLPETIDYCQDSNCAHVLNPSYCDDSGNHPCEDDGDACTDEVCTEENQCTHPAIPNCCSDDSDCDDSDQCTSDTCTAGQCGLQPVVGCCNDDGDCQAAGDACSALLVCDPATSTCVLAPDTEGGAQCCATDLDCDDGCACTTDTCDLNGHICENVPNGQDCCLTDIDCDDGDPQTVDSCDACGCSHVASQSCSDPQDPCDDGNPCTVDACDDLLQRCLHTWDQNCCLGYSDCIDGDDCTTDKCSLGTHLCQNNAIIGCCTGDSDPDCDDSNSCTTEYCIMSECRHVSDPDCCVTADDCPGTNACWEATCDNDVCVYAPASSPECCAIPADCATQPNCSSYDCVDHYCEPTCNCYSDAECDDANPCTCNLCIDGQCHFPSGGAGCDLNPLCCETVDDCDDDGDPCTGTACVNSICKYVPSAGGCVLPIPLRQSFSTCGTLDYCHWSVVDGPTGEVSTESWLVATTGAMGPDRYAAFDGAPQLSPADAFLVTPKLNLGANSPITVQYERLLDWVQDIVVVGVYWSSTGEFAGEEVTLETHMYEQNVGPEWHHTTSETITGQGYVGVNVWAQTTTNLEWFGIDSFRVCPGEPLVFDGEPVFGDVLVSATESFAVDVVDPGSGATVQFSLEGAPNFVELLSGQSNWQTVIQVSPVAPEDAGVWTFDVRADDGCLVSFQEVTVAVVEPGGWAVWQAPEVPASAVDSLVTGIEAAGQSAQLFYELDTIVEWQSPQGAFLPLGVYGSKHVLTADDAAVITQFLDAGGKVYLEGGDTWALDAWTNAQPYFHIVGLDDGPATTTDSLFGNHFCSGADYALSTNYFHNNFLDRIGREIQTSAIPILSDLAGGTGSNPTYHMAVAYEDPTTGYRTIGASVPFAALKQSGGGPLPGYFIEQYLSFLEFGYPPCAGDVECFDSSYCTIDQCVAAACENTVTGGCLECLDDSHCGLQEACHERVECPGGTCVEGLCDNTGEPCLGYQGWACDPIPMDPVLSLWVSPDTPIDIWPGSTGTYTSTIHVDSHYKVGDLTLKVWVQHGYRGDLEVRLTHGATTVVLKEADITDSAEDVYATYEFGVPAADPGGLSAFQGQPLSGDWTLEIEDTSIFDGGQLEHWEFYPWTWCATDSDCDEGDPCTVDTCDAGSGNCLQPHPVDCDDGRACTVDWCDPVKGCVHAANDAPCSPDEACRLAGTVGTGCEAIPYDESLGMFPALDVPVTIPEIGGEVFSTILVGTAGLVGNVNAKVEIAHDAPDELAVYLERLATEGGIGVILKLADEGDVYGASLNRTYTFGVPSSDDLSVFHGLPLAGDWRLTVFDDFGGNGGELTSWKLYFETLGCSTDGDCETGDPCYDGTCNLSIGQCVWAPKDCDDGSICTADSCSSNEPGGCVHTPVNQGAACDDGNVCTENSSCNAGVCEGTAIDCDDGDLCTDDSCEHPGGCTHTFNSVPCDDGDICTENDACSIGSCVGAPISCDDNNPCTTDSCDSVDGCEHASSPGACDDGDPCTNEECQGGTCEVTSQIICDDNNPCTDDSCDPQSGCTYTPNAHSCDDDDPCTLGDVCQDGACQAGTSQQTCDDGNVCTADSCQAGVGCVFTPNAAACDDSDPCTTVDVCSGGACVGSGSLDCNDNNECTTDACVPTVGCDYTFNAGMPCQYPNPEQHNICVVGICQFPACLSAGPVDCDDQNVCTDDSCSSALGGCQNVPNAAACDDMDACTLDDVCAGGSCGGTPLVCDDGTACTVDTCDPGSGCVFTPDDNACDDSNACTDDACDPVTGCSSVIDNTNSCDDGNPCTDDACVDGVCVGTNNSGPCDDGDACTLGDVCSDGSCVAGTEQVDCDDGNPCTTDSCDPGNGCQHIPVDNGTPCDDVDGCTDDHVCAAGQCTGTPKPVGTAAIYGKVFDARNPTAAMNGTTITVANRSPLTCVRSQETTWLDSNTFKLPAPEMGLYVLTFEKDGYIAAQREVELLSDNGTMWPVLMVPIDSLTQQLESDFGTEQVITNSESNIQILVPAGTKLKLDGVVLEDDDDPVDVTMTWHTSGEELPGPLPETSHFTFAITLLPDGLEFVAADGVTPVDVTVRTANEFVPTAPPGASVGFPIGAEIPVGLWNPATGQWEHHDMATVVDVNWIEFSTPHFSSWDVNCPGGGGGGGGGSGGGSGGGGGGPGGGPSGGGGGGGPGGGPSGGGGGGGPGGGPPNCLGCCSPDCCTGPDCDEPDCEGDSGGSSIGRADGSLSVAFELPGVELAGREWSLGFTYNSAVAYPQVHLWGTQDLGVYPANDSIDYPESLRFSWGFEGRQGEAHYVSCHVTDNCSEPIPTEIDMGTVLPARSPDGQTLSTGFYPYWLETAAGMYGEYFLAQRFGWPAIDGGGTGVPYRTLLWERQSFADTVFVDNKSDSPFGAGWSLSGLLELTFDGVTGDAVVSESGKQARIRTTHRLQHWAGVLDGQNWTGTGTKLSTELGRVRHLAVDGEGQVYVSSGDYVRRVRESGVVEVLAGCGTIELCNTIGGCVPTTEDDCSGQPAAAVALSTPSGIAVDSEGQVYFAEEDGHVIRKIDPTGLLWTIAGQYGAENDCASLDQACFPRGVDVEEKADGAYVYFISDILSGGQRQNTLRRVAPDGAVQTLLDETGCQYPCSAPLSALEDCLFLEAGRVLVSHKNGRKLVEVLFDDYGQSVVPHDDMSTYGDNLFAGNGQGLPTTGPFSEGPAQETAIGYPVGLARGQGDDVLVACLPDDNDTNVVIRVTNATGAPADRYVFRIAGETGDFGEGTLTDGADGDTVVLDRVSACSVSDVLWLPTEGSALFGFGCYNGESSIWAASAVHNYASSRFTSLKQNGDEEWTLVSRDGTTHRFDAELNHSWTKDRWGHYRKYCRDEFGLVSQVVLDGERSYLLSYSGGKLSSVVLSTGTNCDDPGSEIAGTESTFSHNAGNDLIAVVRPDAADLHYEYDEDGKHLLTSRYSGPENAQPDKYVEYDHHSSLYPNNDELAAVSKVTFHDDEHPTLGYDNRTYVHSWERALGGMNGGLGTPENPIPPDPDAGWDKTVNALGEEVWTRLDSEGRTLETKKVAGGKTFRTTYVRDSETGYIESICRKGDGSTECDQLKTFLYDDAGNIIATRVHDTSAPDPDATFSEWQTTFTAREVVVDGETVDFTVAGAILNPEEEMTAYVGDDHGNTTAILLVEDWEVDENGNKQITAAKVQRMEFDPPQKGLLRYYCDAACMDDGGGLPPDCAYTGECAPEDAPQCSDPEFDHCRVEYGYDPDTENLTGITLPDGTYVSLQRDTDTGRVLGVTSPVTTGFGTAQSASAQSWTMTQDAWGNPKTMQGPGVGPWSMSFTDPMASGGCSACSGGDKITRIVGPESEGLSEVVTIEYSMTGNPVRIAWGYTDGVTDTEAVVAERNFDNGGRLEDIYVNGELRTHFDYDAAGPIDTVTVKEPLGGDLVWDLTPDNLNRIDSVTAPDGAQWSWVLHYLGGQKEISEAASGRTVAYDRDDVGRVLSRTIGGLRTWSFAYDSLGRLSQLVTPAANQTDLVRDAAGLVESVSRNGTPVDSIQKDDFLRVEETTRQEGGEDTSYYVGYNNAGAVKGFLSRVLELGADDVWMKHYYAYHPSGSLAGIRGRRTGEMLEWMDPALQIDYGYDASGRVNSMSLGVPDVDPALPAVGKARMTLHRDAFGRVDEADWEASEDGVTWDAVKRTVVGYEVGTSRLVQLSTGDPSPGASGIVEADVLDYVLAYDRPGRVTSTEETWGTMGQAFKREYGYDGMSRLTEVREYVGGAGTWNRKYEYAYDTLGQRSRKTLTQDETNPLTVLDSEYKWWSVGTLDNTHEPGNPASVLDEFTSDNDGNLTALDFDNGDSLAFAYDSSRRLAQITDPVGGKYQYLYGPDEVRVGRDIDETGDGTIDVSHRFFSDGLVTYQFDGFSGDLQFAIVYAPDGYTPVFYVTFANNMVADVYFFLNDHLSTPRALVDSDGVVVWKARYEPFGATGDNLVPDFEAGDVGIDTNPDNDETDIHQPLRFPGQWDDGIPGIWYNHHRFYLPDYGMYGRRDPIFRIDGNAYSYAGGNPVSAMDPRGLDMYVCKRTAYLGWCLGHCVHSYAWFTEPSDESNRSKWEFFGVGAGGSGSDDLERAQARRNENPSQDDCVWIADSAYAQEELKEEVVDQILESEAGWWFPPFNDCHDALQDALEEWGYEYPDSFGRLQW